MGYFNCPSKVPDTFEGKMFGVCVGEGEGCWVVTPGVIFRNQTS